MALEEPGLAFLAILPTIILICTLFTKFLARLRRLEKTKVKILKDLHMNDAIVLDNYLFGDIAQCKIFDLHFDFMVS